MRQVQNTATTHRKNASIKSKATDEFYCNKISSNIALTDNTFDSDGIQIPQNAET